MEAIFGLVGVVVGGLLTAGLDTLRARALQRRDERRVARRLIHEMARFGARLEQAVKQERPLLAFTADQLATAWREDQAHLASLSYRDWQSIATAVEGAEQFSESIIKPIHGQSEAALEEVVRMAEQATEQPDLDRAVRVRDSVAEHQRQRALEYLNAATTADIVARLRAASTLLERLAR